MPLPPDMLRLLATVNARVRQDVSLAILATLAHRSRFDLHRRFRATVGETPKAYTTRVRLSRAAAELLSSHRPVTAIAAAHGFAAHETFTRAFARRFGVPPRDFRTRGLRPGEAAAAALHAAVVERVAPCVTLYRSPLLAHPPLTQEGPPVITDITVRDQPAVHALVARRRVAREEIADALGEILPQLFDFALGNGLAMNGPPFTRYPEIGMGTMVIEGGVPLAAPYVGDLPDGIEVVTLPAGPAAVAVHVGPYERLIQTYGALESWVETEGRAAAGPPWETYLTDPGEHPDPETWRTEVVQPIR